jgi:hypothetical protein
MTIYRVDRNWHEVLDSNSVWRVVGTAVVTNFSDLATFITGPYDGQLAYVTAQKGLYRYRSGAWSFLIFAETGGGYARYVHSTLVSVATGGSGQKIPFQTATDPCAQISPSGTGNTDFVFNQAGVWNVTASCRFAANATVAERALFLAKSSDIVNTRYAQANSGSAIAFMASVSTQKRFAAGDSIAVGMFQATGVAINTDVGFAEAFHVSFNWEGP